MKKVLVSFDCVFQTGKPNRVTDEMSDRQLIKFLYIANYQAEVLAHFLSTSKRQQQNRNNSNNNGRNTERL